MKSVLCLLALIALPVFAGNTPHATRVPSSEDEPRSCDRAAAFPKEERKACDIMRALRADEASRSMVSMVPFRAYSPCGDAFVANQYILNNLSRISILCDIRPAEIEP